jgi:hypothetical protein
MNPWPGNNPLFYTGILPVIGSVPGPAWTDTNGSAEQENLFIMPV